MLNAWDFGVAEKRERMILVGIRNDLNITYQFPKNHTYKPVLRDVLKNVPKSPGQGYSETKKRYWLKCQLVDIGEIYQKI